ncbi:MAG: DNA/RNA nuclease SfsA, partial [Clostridia bacterium]|nr:DNA/RNA nuclease SfsA [Clostridia bacterium]
TAPNKVVKEALASGKLLLYGLGALTLIKPETIFGASRFDFYLEAGERKAFVEVKGVTLEEDGVALFPDAPTERGLKHIEELIIAGEKGFIPYIVFVIQMKGVKHFSPHSRTHPDFSESLKKASHRGVHVLSFDCMVTPDSMTLGDPVTVVLP